MDLDADCPINAIETTIRRTHVLAFWRFLTLLLSALGLTLRRRRAVGIMSPSDIDRALRWMGLRGLGLLWT